jgi:hypothetical protein
MTFMTHSRLTCIETEKARLRMQFSVISVQLPETIVQRPICRIIYDRKSRSLPHCALLATSISQWRHTYLGHPHRFTATQYALRTCSYQQLGAQISDWSARDRNASALHWIIRKSVTLWSWVPFERPQVVQSLGSSPVFDGTRRFIASFTRALHLCLSWARPFQSTPPNPIWIIQSILNSKNGVIWDVTPCGSCKNRRFGGT